MEQVKGIIEQWRVEYNKIRLHSSPGGLSPLEFIQQLEESRNTAETLNVGELRGMVNNIVIERCWKTLKYGEIFLKDYENPIEAAQEISRYNDKYNSRRPHDSLGKRTPDEVYYVDLNNVLNQTKIC